MPRLHTYDIHSLVRIASERRLPELERFRCIAGRQPFDIDVVVTADPAQWAAPGAIRYREAFGRFGFSLALERSDERIRAIVSPLIAASPHVLYTNVVEPLLRWLLVRKGHALMHAACLAVGESAVLVTARTDTGKTTTILNALRAACGRLAFLSDDMIVLRPDGRVLAYPKPLTISRHTVQAIGGAPLRAGERLKLVPQSRLHSKGGRGVGMRLYRSGMPAATLSAVVQRLVPPPKFMVDRLIPGTRYATSARLRRVVLIERGPGFREPIPAGELVDLLVANAEDAYGFPPYPVLERELCTWRGVDLHAREREIVAAALEGVPAERVRRPDFGWHNDLLAAADALARDADAPSPAKRQPTAPRAPAPRPLGAVGGIDG